MIVRINATSATMRMTIHRYLLRFSFPEAADISSCQTSSTSALFPLLDSGSRLSPELKYIISMLDGAPFDLPRIEGRAVCALQSDAKQKSKLCYLTLCP